MERAKQPDGRFASLDALCGAVDSKVLNKRLLESLVKFTQSGGRKIDAWTGQHRCAIVPFDLPGDSPHAFSNANTLAELQQLESL